VSLYNDVVELAKPYLGPAAERFIGRQISGHLNIEESQLAAQHLEELARWCYVSGKLIMGEDEAQEFSNKVKALK
jgi:hypothetical protein